MSDPEYEVDDEVYAVPRDWYGTVVEIDYDEYGNVQYKVRFHDASEWFYEDELEWG